MGLMKVKYVGGSDIRHISAKDLDDRGITVSAEKVPRAVSAALGSAGISARGDDLVWHQWNGWSLTMDVSENLEALLRNEGVFTLSKVNDDGSETVEAVALDSDADVETGTVVDNTTGAKSAAKRNA